VSVAKESNLEDDSRTMGAQMVKGSLRLKQMMRQATVKTTATVLGTRLSW